MPLYPPAGGSSFNPASPGPIGGTTPSTIKGTIITATTSIITPLFNVGAGALQGNSSGIGGSGSINMEGTLSTDNTLVSSDGFGNLVINSLNSDTGEFQTDGSGNLNMTGDLNSEGNISFPNIPTSDPHVSGELWSNLGIVTQSAG